jgi:hypothetical protein
MDLCSGQSGLFASEKREGEQNQIKGKWKRLMNPWYA